MIAKLLFCHGARASSWREPFDVLAAAAQAQYAHPVELAFLEFMQPDFATAVQTLVGKGAQQIDVVLLFLAAGGHTRNDVSALVATAQTQHPQIKFKVSDTLLESEPMRQATLQWIADLK
jgi:sirohydrochlorin cobaltochelatase